MEGKIEGIHLEETGEVSEAVMMSTVPASSGLSSTTAEGSLLTPAGWL